ncbi:hypothetical protein DFP72DRAFT_1175625 [Ephemerocybe angulata]|uniref:Uncharacterized protein n=1 Tax=Ephemerocybe angulata TaxID=980116 RepID=A0A8H6LY67_9AGAR|nr:hypothetical protein DFP72DRAFT_1175625 [Tulosesus angulatus]
MGSTALIVCSALITVLETVPTFYRVNNRAWFGMEAGSVVVSTKVLSFYGIIGLHSVLPFYVELMIGQDTSVLFLLCVFRPFRCDHTILLTIELMYLSVRRSHHALLPSAPSSSRYSRSPSRFQTQLLYRYFAERGTWGAAMDTFLNGDDDPTQVTQLVFVSAAAAAWFDPFSILRMFPLPADVPLPTRHTILLAIEVKYISVRRSQHALLAIGFFVAMMLTVFSTHLHFAERGSWDKVHQL